MCADDAGGGAELRVEERGDVGATSGLSVPGARNGRAKRTCGGSPVPVSWRDDRLLLPPLLLLPLAATDGAGAGERTRGVAGGDGTTGGGEAQRGGLHHAASAATIGGVPLTGVLLADVSVLSVLRRRCGASRAPTAVNAYCASASSRAAASRADGRRAGSVAQHSLMRRHSAGATGCVLAVRECGRLVGGCPACTCLAVRRG